MPPIAASEPKKPVRKRRRNDETTPKVERKITEFCQVKVRVIANFKKKKTGDENFEMMKDVIYN